MIESVKLGLDGMTLVTNRYTRIGNGINYQDANGNWVPSVPVVKSFVGGIVCTGASYQVILATHLNTAGAVDLLTSDKKEIISRPLGIAFFDPVTSNRVMLAKVKECRPELVSSNQIAYADAFEGNGIRAAVVYQYDVGQFRQDVTFLQCPSVSPSSFGLSNQTRLEILTEIEQSPAPAITPHTLRSETNPALRARMAQPDLVDDVLSFGQMRMPLGHAFRSEPTARQPLPRGVPVAKQLLTIDGRVILVEGVPWAEVTKQLQELPAPATSANAPGGTAGLALTLPTRRLAGAGRPSFEARLAEITRSHPMLLASTAVDPVQNGFVIDYVLVQSGTMMTFQSSTTYFVNGQVYLYGTTTFNPCVIKYGGGFSGLTVEGAVSAMYFGGAVVLTSMNDNSVGAVISGSTGHPESGPSAGWTMALEYLSGDTFIGPLDIRYAYGGVYADYSAGRRLTLASVSLKDVYEGIQAGQIASVTVNSASVCFPDYPSWGSILWQEAAADQISVGNVTTCVGDFDNDTLPDAWEYKYFGSLSQAATGDPDGDGLNNLQEYQAGADPCESDTDGDGLPDAWEIQYFGTFNASGDTLDGNGNTLLYDYQNGLDPTAINFSIHATNNYVRTSETPLQLAVQGVPYYRAVLVDDTDFAHANWQTYSSSNLTVNLGSNQGWHQVWIGLKAFYTSSSVAWVSKRLDLMLTPPMLTITNPTPGIVTQPIIELQGYCPVPLSAISYALTNANGLWTNQTVLILDRFFDTNLFAFTTNYFQAFDIPLAPGTNTITLQATDESGNVGTEALNYVLDYSTKIIPPVVDVYWPQDDAQVCGDTFTWRGHISDFTAIVAAQVVDANGNTIVANAVVERDGDWWVENLPLSSGINRLVLTATDAAGNVTTTNITITQSTVGLSINPFPDPSQLWNPTIDVSGAISDPSDYAVWVNGVKAVVNGDGTWTASDVATTLGGTAVFQARAIPNSDNGGNGIGGSGGGSSSYANPGNPSSTQAQDADSQADKPPRVYVKSYTVSESSAVHPSSEANNSEGSNPSSSQVDDECQDSLTWRDDEGGNSSYVRNFDYVLTGGNNHSFSSTDHQTAQWPATTWPKLVDGTGTEDYQSEDNGVPYSGSWPSAWPTPSILFEHCQFHDSASGSIDWYSATTDMYGHSQDSVSYSRTAQTVMMLNTGGKADSRQQNLFQITATAKECNGTGLHLNYVAPWIWWEYDGPPDWGQWFDIDPTRITVLGKPLDSSGNLYVALPDGATKDVTPQVAGVDYYTFSVGAQKYKLALLFKNTKMSDWKPIDPLYPNITARLGVLKGDRVTFTPGWYPSAPPIPPSEYVWSGVASGTGNTISVPYDTTGQANETLAVKGIARTAVANAMEILPPNEATWGLVEHPFEGILALTAGNEALSWAQGICLHPIKAWNCRADAVRHAYWVALMIHGYGLSPATAQAAATAHERTNFEQGGNHNESVMDMENNLKGLGVSGGDKAAMQNGVRQMADKGELTVLDELPNFQERGVLVPSDFQGY